MFPLEETITVWRPIETGDGTGRKNWVRNDYPGKHAYIAKQFVSEAGEVKISVSVAYTEGDIKFGDMIFFGLSTSVTPESKAQTISLVKRIPSETDMKKAVM